MPSTWVRSRPGEGSTFCIALPLSADAVQGSDDDYEDETDFDQAAGDEPAGGDSMTLTSADIQDHAHGRVG